MSTAKGSGQIVISTDGHAGADIQGYRPYLEKKYHDEFDSWAATYEDPWGELTGPSTDEQGHGFEQGIGFAAFDIPINWDSDRRHKLMNSLGITAEVLFPNTAPPFVAVRRDQRWPRRRRRPSTSIAFAGIKAHNRWMADFCQDAPGQRAGFAQLFLNDLDAAVAEARWAKENGLRGVLLPADHVQGLVNLYQPAHGPALGGVLRATAAGASTPGASVDEPARRWGGLVLGRHRRGAVLRQPGRGAPDDLGGVRAVPGPEVRAHRAHRRAPRHGHPGWPGRGLQARAWTRSH